MAKVNGIDEIKVKLQTLMPNALQAVGIEAMGKVIEQMQNGYSTPHGNPAHTAIRQTGDLMRDVQYEVVDDHTVKVGNSLEYALFVHDGTYKLEARPYIKDAIEQNIDRFKEIFEDYLRNGVGS